MLPTLYQGSDISERTSYKIPRKKALKRSASLFLPVSFKSVFLMALIYSTPWLLDHTFIWMIGQDLAASVR